MLKGSAKGTIRGPKSVGRVISIIKNVELAKNNESMMKIFLSGIAPPFKKFENF